jgi:60 kDa SS-A/Ro ribonucleoprotein
MSKWNQVVTATKADTVNRAGGEAFTETPEVALVNLLLTSFMKDKFYETAKDEQARLTGLLGKVDPQFAAKAAIYARKRFGMRSITHFTSAWIAKNVHGSKWARGFFEKAASTRVDDVTEILACYAALNGSLHPIPMALKRGLAAALSRFSEYALSKYKGEGKALKLVDAVNLVHPRHTPALTALVKGTLKPADTWESAISAAGKTEGGEEAVTAKKKEEWARLIKERRLGYFALIRNIRNIAEAGLDDDAFAEFLKQIQNPEAIKKSLVMPFRILVAYKVSQSLGRTFRQRARGSVVFSETALLAEALSAALDLALVNVPDLPGRTLVALDRSASMTTAINQRSFGETPVPIMVSDVGAIFAAALAKKGADVMTFSDSAKYERLFNRKDSIVSIAESVTNQSGGTNFHSIFENAQAAYDRIIMLSDMQAWVGYATPEDAFKRYRQKYGCSPHVYCFNLTSYGDTQFPASKVYQLSGLSDKVFDTMALLETDRLALVKEINAIEL